jgi:hypothetical protein
VTNSVSNRNAQVLFGPDCMILTFTGEPNRTASRADHRPARYGRNNHYQLIPQELQ